jgi:hypothetical protein
LPTLVRWLAAPAALALLLGAGLFLHWWMAEAFYDKNYAPAQPIKFSHELHAGQYKIDCLYCHSNTQQGKHGGVPPTSICLGCHGADKGNVGANKAEIIKLRRMTDPASDGYLTMDGTRKEGGSVHWNRVHLLPDHVYFSHEWHVKAGVGCETCHGPVDKMVTLKQVANLSMGWCIQCHRSNNYVSKGDKADAFLVGTGDYDVLRHRIRPDDVVRLVPEMERIQGHQDSHGSASAAHGDAHHGDAHHGDAHHGDAHHAQTKRYGYNGSIDHQVQTMEYFTHGQEAKLQQLLKQHPDLPRWRVQDLPETHRAFYGDQAKHWQNAPTHCSTCHQ